MVTPHSIVHSLICSGFHSRENNLSCDFNRGVWVCVCLHMSENTNMNVHMWMRVCAYTYASNIWCHISVTVHCGFVI